METVLGLDLGTNSIGWALVKQDFDNKEGQILGMGSRIIPMDQAEVGRFAEGSPTSKTADRTRFRGIRRIRERHLLRRERLHRVLNILGFLPHHYSKQIDFNNNPGKFLDEREPKIAYNDSKFLFDESFNEMLKDFGSHQPDLLKNGKLIPYDWTIYYLRKKGLNEKLKKEEIAWIILNFNQKRGYYQLRGEEEESLNKLVEYHSLRITDVVPDEKPGKNGEIWYSLILENGWVYRRSSKTTLENWKDKVRDFIVITDLNDDGTIKKDKDGNEKRSFRAPGEDDWNLKKKKTESEIDQSGQTVGTYIYNTLLKNPVQKIRGKLVRTIERKYYKDELVKILRKQIELQPEFFPDELITNTIRDLYKNNPIHQTSLTNGGFLNLIVNDIIFYQRPLRSQKSNIGRCTLEYRNFKTKGLNDEVINKTEYLKAIPKSHPLFLEFRLWQWISNLKILTKTDETDITKNLLKSVDDYESLFQFLNEKKEIKQEALIKYFLEKTGLKGKVLKQEIEKYRWNYVEDKPYPCNETGELIRARLAKVKDLPSDFLSKKIEEGLWHIIYSVTDKVEFEKALKTFSNKHHLDEMSFFDAFRKIPPFSSDYGSFSFKAINRLLPLMRLGKYWNWDNIDENTKTRIDKLLNGEFDEKIKLRVREKAKDLQSNNDFQGLPLWLAQYIVYDRHSESDAVEKWRTVDDLNEYIKSFKQHSLRNPIVEQIIMETLRVVRDIWKEYGHNTQNFFDEIHVELGREMKNTKDERARINRANIESQNTNLRIKAFLQELLDDSDIENVRPYSPIQQEILKIYEQGVLDSDIEIPGEISKISKAAQPSKSEFQRYKLWLEQKYRSPYTGQPISLSKLFSPQYEIEHIIPQSRFFDDSFSNKVICESAINKLKNRQLGMEFIKNHQGEIVETGFGESVKVLSDDAYTSFVNDNFKGSRSKRLKLLMEEIPEKMIERQLNDTRYISKFISNILSNLVRTEDNDDGINSQNLISGNGKVTSTLRQDWGLNDVWNDLILPRFERLNHLTGTKDFTSWNENHQKQLPVVPLELSRGFQKKRIDHRHHALDALVVACATRDHINLLNNQAAGSDKKRYDLQNKLRNKEKYKDNKGLDREKFTTFIKPWHSYTQDARNKLESIIVSFKQNLRVINKTNNKYWKYVDEDGKMGKKLVAQTKGDNWAIRKPLHKDTVSGLIKLRKTKEVNLSVAVKNKSDIVDRDLRKKIQTLFNENKNEKEILAFFKNNQYQWEGQNVNKVKLYYWKEDIVASRVNLDTTFNEQKILNSVTDTGIQKILLNHLEKYKGQPDHKGKEIAPELLAFTPEGIDEMNKNIVNLNGGKFHQPIIKLRTYEPRGNKFQVGQKGNKNQKYVEAAKGTNLFFAIYMGDNDKRVYQTIPLNIVIERQKQGLSPVPEINNKGNKLLFHLSPNDLVYVPEPGETTIPKKLNPKRIYKMVSSSGTQCFFVRQEIAVSIIDKMEFSALNKMERGFNLEMIKDICKKLNINRLGKLHSVFFEDNWTVEEPLPTYHKGIESGLTFEDLENDQLKHNLALSPEERLAEHKKLSDKIFPKAENDKDIHFKKED